MIIKYTLEEQDFIITTAGDGEEGLIKFFEHKPDVLVADVKMPLMDGFEMVRRIRQSDKATPVLFLTARSATVSYTHLTVRIEKDSLLYKLFETEVLPVNSFHHQAVKELSLIHI